MKKLILISLFAFGHLLMAQSVSEDMDSLGGNKDLLKKSKAWNGENKVKVVQKRAVDRNNRFEFGLQYGLNAGGDPYVSTNQIGGIVEFHFNPRLSLGVRYTKSYNALSTEGRRVFDEAKNNQNLNNEGSRPDLDYVDGTTLGVLSFYPFYGKMSFLEMGVTQFDMYGLVGGGTVQLSQKTSSTFTTGFGMGFWWSKHFSSRLEVRYQTYKDEIYTGPRNVNLTVISAGVGFLL